MTSARVSKRLAAALQSYRFGLLIDTCLAVSGVLRFRKPLNLVGDTGIEPVTPAV